MGFPWKQILNIGLNVGTTIAGNMTGVSAFSMIPSLVMAIEKAFTGNGTGTGKQKKAVALETALSLIILSEGISRRDLIDNEKFMNALDRIIDDVVELENALHWKKDSIQVPLNVGLSNPLNARPFSGENSNVQALLTQATNLL